MQYHQQRQAAGQPTKRRRIFVPKETEEVTTQYPDDSYNEDTPVTGPEKAKLTISQKRTRSQEPDDYEAGSHITALSKRYDGIPMSDGVIYRKGNEQIYVHNSPPPQPIRRANRTTERQQTLSPPAKTQSDPKQRRWHWLFFIGIAFLIMVIGYVVFNAFGAWWQVRSDDSSYGQPRTFQTDAVVGHGDAPDHPSHFIAMNLNRHIIIIEIPGGDVSRSIIYSGPTLLGDNQNLTPVTLSFSDVNGDGRADMLVHILGQEIIYLNNGAKFVSPSNITTGGSNLPNWRE